MISNLRRYKSEIARIKRDVEIGISRRSGTSNSVFRGTSHYRLQSKEPPLYGLEPDVEWQIPIKGNLIMEEDNQGIVYIGIDMGNYRHYVWSSERTKQEAIHAMILGTYYWEESWNKYIYPCCGITLDEFRNDKKIIDRTQVYSDVEKIYDTVDKSYKTDFSLKDKQWPRLKNRKMYPIVTVDFSKEWITYQNDEYSETYRQNLKNIALRDPDLPRYIAFHRFSRYLYDVNATCDYGKMW